MSQNWRALKNGREILYGFDAPTGGFFLSEFYSDEEGGYSSDEIVFSDEGMTLSDLNFAIIRYSEFHLDTQKMIEQLRNSSYPTKQQIEMGKIFGKDIVRSLELVGEDLLKNWEDSLSKFIWS